jgi:hypothetical protein
VIKIRYADLPGGLHIQAVARGGDTVIYLLPGLTAEQRQAALRRARSSGRMGQGPRLPAAGVAGAVMVARIRTTVRNGAAAIRGHPAIFVPPILIIVTAAVAYLLLVPVSIRMIPEPQASDPGDPVPAAVAPPPGSRAQDPGPQPRYWTAPTRGAPARQAPARQAPARTAPGRTAPARSSTDCAWISACWASAWPGSSARQAPSPPSRDWRNLPGKQPRQAESTARAFKTTRLVAGQPGG